jgi:transposase
MSGDNCHQYQRAEYLRREYVDSKRSATEIARECDTTPTTIRKWLRRHNIEIRGAKEAQQARHEDRPYTDKSWLREKYHKQQLSTQEVAGLCDVSKETIRRWLNNHSIETRDHSEAAQLRVEKHPHTVGNESEAFRNANAWEQMGKEEQDEFREWLSKRRTGENNPMWNVTGADHPQWNPDREEVNFYSSKEWSEARRKALERDGHQCRECGGTDWELHVHHRTPVSEGGAPFRLDNLMALCARCHDQRHPNVDILASVQADE